MKRTGRRIFGAAAVILALLLLAWEIRRVRAIQSDAADIEARRVELAKKSHHLEESIAQLRRDEERLKALLSRSLSKEKMTEADEHAREYQRTKPLHSWLELKNSRLYGRLGLSPETGQKLEDIQAAHWLRLGDIDATARADGLSPNDPAITLLKSQESEQFKQDEAALLGPADAQIAQEYERTGMARAIADGVAGNIFDSATPLTAEQSERLTQILANNSPSYLNGGAATTKDMNFQNASAQAQAILTPSQLAALNNYFSGTLAMRTLGPLIQAALGAQK